MWGGCWLAWSAAWALKWSCLPLSPVVSLHVGGGCWLVWSASWALKWSCLPLSPVVSGCLPSCGGWVGWVLVGVVGFLGSEVVLSPVVSRCLRLSPFMWGLGVGWCGRLLGLCSGLVSRCLPLSPVVSLHVGRVLVGVVGFLGSEVVLSPVVSGCVPACGGCGIGYAA